MHTYSCKIVRLVDADTIEIDIDLGFNMWMVKERIRLHDVDAPESRTSDDIEKHFGNLSTDYVASYLTVGAEYKYVSKEFHKDQYGRSLGDFEVYDQVSDSWKMLTELMVRDGHAVVWKEGEDERMLSDKHSNWRKLIESGKSGGMTLPEAGLE